MARLAQRTAINFLDCFHRITMSMSGPKVISIMSGKTSFLSGALVVHNLYFCQAVMVYSC
jgi:hypothetical protein